MHLNKDSKRIVLLIGIGCFIFCIIMFGIFILTGHFNLSVLWGGLIGTALAITNFTVMAHFLQKAIDDPDKAKNITQISYTLRNLLNLILTILAIVLLKVNPIAVIVPYIFPRLSIYIMQLTGLYHSDNDYKLDKQNSQDKMEGKDEH